MKNTFIILIVGCLLTACDTPTQLIVPTYQTRVPRPVGLVAVQDTLANGKTTVTVSWSVSTTANLKDFELYRSIAGDYFIMIQAGFIFTYQDTTITWANPTDSLQLLQFAVVPIGIDRYRGQSSDTLSMYMTKK